MKAASAKRHVALVVLAAGALVLKRSYHGPWAALVHDYGGNLTASFAVYFVGAIAAAGLGLTRPVTALLALLVVESFEVTTGFGVMANVYTSESLSAWRPSPPDRSKPKHRRWSSVHPFSSLETLLHRAMQRAYWSLTPAI